LAGAGTGAARPTDPDERRLLRPDRLGLEVPGRERREDFPPHRLSLMRGRLVRALSVDGRRHGHPLHPSRTPRGGGGIAPVRADGHRRQCLVNGAAL